MIRDYGDFLYTKDPPGHTISTSVSLWGSLEVWVDEKLVIEDDLFRIFWLEREYKAPLGDGHEMTFILRRPVVKTHYWRFWYYIDGKIVRTRCHSFFLQRFRESPSVRNLIKDLVDNMFWPVLILK